MFSSLIPLFKIFFRFKTNRNYFFGFYEKMVLPNKSVFNVYKKAKVKNSLFWLNLFDWIPSQLYFTGTYIDENKTLMQFLSLSKNNDVFWDIGANIGLYSILMANQNGKNITVVAFEPVLDNVNNLNKNITLNKLSNIKVEQVALCSKQQNLDFYISEESNSGMSSALATKNAQKIIKVNAISGDNYLAKNPDLIPNIIKIDTEGFEFEILKGLESIIKNYRPIIAFEWDLNLMKKTGLKPEDFVAFFEPYHYILKSKLEGDFLDIMRLRNNYPLIFAIPV